MDEEMIEAMKVAGRKAAQGMDERIPDVIVEAAHSVLTEIIEPFVDYHGDLPDYDHPLRPVYESGVQYAVEMLAKVLKVEDWEICDGTEEFDGDLGGTLLNIVIATWPKDEHGDWIDLRDSTLRAAHSVIAGQIAELHPAIAHGDDEHRAWLKEAIEAHFANRPVPKPRGQGRKEAKIAELEGERDHLRRCLGAARPYISDKAGAGILSAIDTALAQHKGTDR